MKSKGFLSQLLPFFLALILIGSLLAISCSSKTTTPSSTNVIQTTSTTAKPSTPPPTTTTVAAKKGGTLKIIYGMSPNAIGYGPSMQRSDDILAASPCVETLLHIDSAGAIIPWLATDMKSNPSDNTTMITIRKGIKFHDGTDFNAQAVKWNLESEMAIKRSETQSIKSIDVIDDYTLRLNQTYFDNTLAFSFTSYPGLMVSPAYFQNNGGEKAASTHPVGTGPFKFVSFERDVSLKYTKWDGYWQTGKPYLDGVQFTYITDPMVQLASFQAGEGDVLLNVAPKDAKNLQSSGKYNFSMSGGSLWGLAGDGTHDSSPFANIKVRQAVEYAIDRDSIVQAIGLGYWQSTDQPTSKGTWAYNTTPSPYSYNSNKARDLLREAGYPNGIAAKLIARNNPAEMIDFYTAILALLNNAGFNLSLDITESAKFNDYVMKTGWTNSMLGWNGNEYADYSRILNVAFSGWGVPYRSILHPAEVDSVIKQIIQSADFNTQKAKTQEAMGLIRDKYCSFTTLCRITSIAGKYKYVHDDSLYITPAPYQCTLQDAWLDK